MEVRHPAFFDEPRTTSLLEGVLAAADVDDAPILARRFRDEVRACLPQIEALPQPTPAAPLTLF